MTAIPVIDVAPLRSAKQADRDAVAREIAVAARATGFFSIVGHDIAPALIAEVFEQAKRFFALPLAAKMALDASRFGNRGYDPLRAQTLEPGMPPDVKEGFAMDRNAENVWPAELPAFRPVMERYADAMAGLSLRVMRGMARSLDLPEDRFDEFCADGPIATVRLLHYPEQPANALPGEKGCGAHTDWGAITFLMQDDAGGLQVLGPDGWLDVAPVPGAYVVNIGDMMERWTNGRYRSTMHRVINTSGRPRYSIPFFFDGPPAYEVACLPSCLDADELPKFPPITVGEHLAEMVRRSFA